METEDGLVVYYQKTEVLQNRVNYWKIQLLKKKKKVSKLKNLIKYSNSPKEISDNILGPQTKSAPDNLEQTPANKGKVAVTATMSQIQQFLTGLKLELVGFNEETQTYLTDWVEEAGGELVFMDFEGEMDYLVTPCTGGNSRHRFKKHVSSIWLEDCLDQGELLDVAYFHKIIHIDKDLKPLEGVVTGLSGYTGREREFLNSLVESLGGLPQEIFAKRDNKDEGARGSTHLICPEGVGQKYTAAIQWKLPVINCFWLLACLREKRWVNESPFLVGDSTVFTPGKPMPVEAAVEASTVQEDKTLQDDMVMAEGSKPGSVGEVSFPGEVSRREELRRKSVDRSGKSVDLTLEAGNMEELRRKSLDSSGGKSADLTKGSGNVSRFTEVDDTRHLEETRGGNGPETPVTNVSKLPSMIDTPRAALDTPTLERLRPQPLNFDISVTPQSCADSPSQVPKLKRDSVCLSMSSKNQSVSVGSGGCKNQSMSVAMLSDETKVTATCSSFNAASPSLHRKIKSFVPPFKKGKENMYNEEITSPQNQQRSLENENRNKKRAISVCKPKAISTSVKHKKDKKEKASDIFDYSDDPDVMEILKREKAKAKNVKKGSKVVKGIQKMMQFGKKLGQRKRNRFPKYCEDKECESPAKRQKTDVSKTEEPSSPDSIPMSPSLMISPVLPRKLTSLEEDEIDDDVENDSNEYVPDLDELLKLPERPADGSKTKDEILDEFDRQIAERQRLHEEEMAQVEADMEAENQKRIERKMRLKENAKFRNRLEIELTETRLRSMFQENLEYLHDISSGKEESPRHEAFHKSIRTRHALYYAIITDPFTDDQLDWTLDEIGKVWMSNRREQLDNKEYVWKVLLPECFIKFYMDFFNVSKNEAMTRISETPLHKKDRLKEFMSKSDFESDED